jgi:hypothetical protein
VSPRPLLHGSFLRVLAHSGHTGGWLLREVLKVADMWFMATSGLNTFASCGKQPLVDSTAHQRSRPPTAESVLLPVRSCLAWC